MNFIQKLNSVATKNNSLVCVGLDPVLDNLPKSITSSKQPFFDFNKTIIDATADLVCAYKPNSAFYEALGADGLEQLQKTCHYISENCPDIPLILDAKRADIGNTNDAYGQFAFDYLGVDSITLHPYLGGEALQPFLDRKDKGMIILCRTSNPGAAELQDLEVGGKKIYQIVAERVSKHWNKNGNCLLVVGATYPDELAQVRKIVGEDMWILLPGIGSQGGDLQKSLKAGLNEAGSGLMVSSTRDIIFASNGPDFAVAARSQANKLRDEINQIRGIKK